MNVYTFLLPIIAGAIVLVGYRYFLGCLLISFAFVYEYVFARLS
jgi:hypothetical protein